MSSEITDSALEYSAGCLDELAVGFPTRPEAVDLVTLADDIAVLAHHIQQATERAQNRPVVPVTGKHTYRCASLSLPRSVRATPARRGGARPDAHESKAATHSSRPEFQSRVVRAIKTEWSPTARNRPAIATSRGSCLFRVRAHAEPVVSCPRGVRAPPWAAAERAGRAATKPTCPSAASGPERSGSG